MGTPEFSIPTLKSLINSEHKIVCVYTQPSQKKFRGQQIQKTPVHIFSETKGIQVRTNKLTDDNELIKFKNLKPDLVVVVAFGQIIPDIYLQIPNLIFLNVHASLLPRWRGAAPIERAILNGDEETGISIMKIVKKLDAGPYIKQTKINIDSDTSSGELREKLSLMGAEALKDSIDLILLKKEDFKEQNDKKATYAKKIEKVETKINWLENAENLF
jgi:methionyl-tRNA formyltransferase